MSEPTDPAQSDLQDHLRSALWADIHAELEEICRLFDVPPAPRTPEPTQ